ncbi:MAG: dephospho-CoA kinase [Firmicutes bacterium]|jgi:dephospho-CoA kinase|nr:dephospho-CoA kinase [Bacillota bacterium]NBI63293.1 dephospho-CoA kinase [Clostridiales bacterium]
MDVIGLTGGIGAGKSTVSAYLQTKGFVIIDADQIARQVTAPGSPLLAELGREFGTDILTEEGGLDRKTLAAIVFADVEKRKKLDSLTHGRIIQRIQEQMETYEATGIHRGIIIDAPLLFETGLNEKCQKTWLVTAKQDIRITRVCARDGMTAAEVAARIRNQMDDEEKKKRADRIIDNSGTIEELKQQIQELIEQGGYDL